jgi:(1->4)-alpha-D-glucan 1-alpha-D-glucosylmutase
MRVPSATYRIQFSLNFRFADAENLVPYLHQLGISHLYSSPRGKARKGSLHGYDVADPLRVNSELGTEEEFTRLVGRLKQYGMGLLLDIVPNHMVASSENAWWMDVLENGRESPYATYFDIAWESPGAKSPELGRNRVVVPMLTDLYDRILTHQGITVRLDEKGLYVQVEGNRIPINPKTYPVILKRSLEILNASHPADQTKCGELEELVRTLEALPSADMQNATAKTEQNKAKLQIKQQLWQLYLGTGEIRKAIDQTLGMFNGAIGEPLSFDSLDSLLSMQAYRLAYWRNASEEVNYRRFFGLNDLITLRVEDPQVFAATHGPIFRLVSQDRISGLRVDHIDGLRDPLEYLERLQAARKLSEPEDSDRLNVYTIVEKITSGSETVPQEWPTAGTTGYDFLNAVNTLFIDATGSRELEHLYREFTGIRTSFSDTWYVRKKQVMEELFASDIRVLSYFLGRLATLDRLGRDIPMRELVRGLKEITACLPIYRTYCRDLELPERDRVYLVQAFKKARDRTPEGAVSDAAFDFLRSVFLLSPSIDAPSHKKEWLEFLLRWQQFTGAVMGKGLEDTAFFVHHGLISLNEVGCNPFRREIRFGAGAFHQFNQEALKERPFTLNATSTHDSKWSEDVRARINVLSELPEEWRIRLRGWAQLNESKKRKVDGRDVPSPNEEVLLYQSMLGMWSLGEEVNLPELRERLEAFILKAAREAKTHSSWVSPNEAHEAALRGFISAILEPSAESEFLSDFSAFLEKIALYGACNGYSQLLLKMTSPGVPDFFQGSEIWNLRLTDPDNRVAVDFEKRITMLEELTVPKSDSTQIDLADLLKNWQDGRLKLALTKYVLNFRRSHRQLFSHGDYLALETAGKKQESVCAFARRFEDDWAIIAAPRLLTKVVEPGMFPVGGTAWGTTVLVLPSRAPVNWTDLFTGESLSVSDSGRTKSIPLARIFLRLPFAVLTSPVSA